REVRVAGAGGSAPEHADARRRCGAETREAGSVLAARGRARALRRHSGAPAPRPLQPAGGRTHALLRRLRRGRVRALGTRRRGAPLSASMAVLGGARVAVEAQRRLMESRVGARRRRVSCRLRGPRLDSGRPADPKAAASAATRARPALRPGILLARVLDDLADRRRPGRDDSRHPRLRPPRLARDGATLAALAVARLHQRVSHAIPNAGATDEPDPAVWAARC